MAHFLAIISGGGATLIIVALFLAAGNLAGAWLTPSRQHWLMKVLFVLTGLAALKFSVHLNGEILLDQRAAALAVAAVFGGIPTALMTGAAMLAYRAYIGGAAMVAGLCVIVAALVACCLLVLWWQRRNPARVPGAGLIVSAGVTAGLVSAFTLLLVPPLESAGHLFRQQAVVMFLVQVVSTCLFGFLLKLQADRLQGIDALEQSNRELHDALLQAIGALSTVMSHRDPGVAGHEMRVAELAHAIGAELGLGADRLEGVRLAALVHDIGKIQVPAEILMRPRKLTKPEFDLVKLHVEAGYRILKDIRFPWPLADIVMQHHENFDGGGYPQGLSGMQILLEARILRVADSLEAMLSHRPFRRAYDFDYAIASLEADKGKCFDPQVVDACTRVFRDRHFELPPYKKAA